MFDAIVAGSHLRHDGVWQRPHHVLARLGLRVPVLYVEEQLGSGDDHDTLEPLKAFDVLRPLRRAPAPGIDGATLAAVRAWCGRRRPLVWLYSPMLLALADAFDTAPLVYDCMDDLAAFAFAPPEMRAREAELLARAGVVFAGGRSLFARRAGQARHLVLAPSGVEFERFAQAAAGPPHPALAGLSRPVFGYFGVLDERIDLATVAALGDTIGTTVMIGPVAKIDSASLPRGPRLRYPGQVDYGELPRFLAGFDVAIMPFALNAATASISPTKTPEYLAGARPVVSTPIADVIADYGTAVRFAATPSEFAEACAEEARAPDRERVARGLLLARHAGWDAVVERMLTALRTLLGAEVVDPLQL
jgi:UDP-galactopyranose mutase